MPRWLRLSLIVLAVIAVILGGLYWWFLGDNGRPSDPPVFSIDMSALREAAVQPGGLPTEVRVEIVGRGTYPRATIAAGGGFTGFDMAMAAYQVVYPDRSVVIDTALDRAAGDGFGLVFDDDALARVYAGMSGASQIVLTHEHSDHIGGILAHPDPAAIKPLLSLTVEQIANAGRMAAFTMLPPVLEEATPIAYEDIFPVAPGIVLIKAPGHSPGSQLVYVLLADGREYLFAGDIGWSFRNIEEVTGRPRAVSQFMLSEDRDAVFGQLAALEALHRAEPGIVIVPGHDGAYLDRLVSEGAMTAGFSLP